MMYMYRVERGTAILTKVRPGGVDDPSPPCKIGSFKNDALARQACESHFAKVCSVARASNRTEPTIFFI